jgi:hypothetical protein
LILGFNFNFEPVGGLDDNFFLILRGDDFHLFFCVVLNEEEFIKCVLRGDVFLFNSEDHPNAPSGDFDGGDNEDDDVGFHGYSAEYVRRHVEHPYESEYEVEEDDSVIYFFVAVNEFGS